MLLRIESPIEIEPYITETQTIAEKIAIKDIKKVFIDDSLRQFISIHIATAITTPIKKQKRSNNNCRNNPPHYITIQSLIIANNKRSYRQQHENSPDNRRNYFAAQRTFCKTPIQSKVQTKDTYHCETYNKENHYVTLLFTYRIQFLQEHIEFYQQDHSS